jgi:glycosyltransferase involved in cell wall biosynthesis
MNRLDQVVLKNNYSASKKSTRKIDLDIIIVTKNRSEKLLRAISSLLTSKIGFKQLIIIDSSKQSQFKDDLSRYLKTKKHSCSIYYFLIKDHGLGFSRNLGINLAKSKYYSFLDDDETVTDQFFLAIEKYLIHGKRQVLCGHPKVMYPDNFFNKVWAEVWPPDKETTIGSGHIISASASAFETRWIQKKKILFDEEMTQSGEEENFSKKVFSFKGNFFYTPEFWAYHEFRTTLKGFIVQWFLYGKSARLRCRLNNSNLESDAEELKVRISKKTSLQDGKFLFIGHKIKEVSFWLGYYLF